MSNVRGDDAALEHELFGMLSKAKDCGLSGDALRKAFEALTPNSIGAPMTIVMDRPRPRCPRNLGAAAIPEMTTMKSSK
jgi:hypothetical protein